MRQVGLVAEDGVLLDAVLHEPAGEPKGMVVALHGITGDMEARGKFPRLADILVAAGCAMLRFSFRGHGRSGGTSADVTIAGEILDLRAALAYARSLGDLPLSLVATSFGAVSATLSLPDLEGRLAGLVLWCPVLDLRHTFLEPQLPWGRANFGPQQQRRMLASGTLLIDGRFAIGRPLWEEFALRRPLDELLSSSVPTLIVHGDQDSYVSYEVARAASRERVACEFRTIIGAEHGFDTREREDEAILATADWLLGGHHAS
ncbi:alpha/beta hydrolase [Nonomuraea sp. NPDC050451]|uniref:alpha/beta hydrolase n=1 Tax=Nonomuraea sp. NPDC050451 TaxID=3364364 RepID=UPI00379DE50E